MKKNNTQNKIEFAQTAGSLHKTTINFLQGATPEVWHPLKNLPHGVCYASIFAVKQQQLAENLLVDIDLRGQRFMVAPFRGRFAANRDHVCTALYGCLVKINHGQKTIAIEKNKGVSMETLGKTMKACAQYFGTKKDYTISID